MLDTAGSILGGALLLYATWEIVKAARRAHGEPRAFPCHGCPDAETCRTSDRCWRSALPTVTESLERPLAIHGIGFHEAATTLSTHPFTAEPTFRNLTPLDHQKGQPMPEDRDHDPGLEPDTLQALMTVAKTVRVYYEALLAEGFQPAEALRLSVGYQEAILTTNGEQA